MNELIDHEARERFRTEWDRNFAVSANAGSGKTTAISERLAAIALAPAGAERLRHTAVVTYTKKAAAQIGQRARQVLLRRITESGSPDLRPLDHLERAFFGTIHSFCLKLAQTYGQTVGINLNPTVVTENDDAWWEEFLEQDAMEFSGLDERALRAFLRHVPLEEIFPVARELDHATAAALRRRTPAAPPAVPDAAAGQRLLAIVPKGNGAANTERSQQTARAWRAAWEAGATFLPLYEPAGKTKIVVDCAREWMLPLKNWLADAAAALAGELAERYRAWRFERGVQTYADQIDAAMAVLHDDALLNRIRAEGWRVILDEAQDTDPQQFAVLVEIARPPGARRGAWPDGGTGAQAEGPRAGHFCMVGDGQQAIYGSRADIGNFMRHVDAFRRGDGGELLEFEVTFRAPHALIALLNSSLPVAFGHEREYNFGLPPPQGAPAPFLQVPYVPLEPGPKNVPGAVYRLRVEGPAESPRGVEAWLECEARQVATWLRENGPGGLGAEGWGDVAVLAPRNEWLVVARKAFETAGLEVALQTRRTRCGDNPAYAWLTGLLAVCVDPENMFEWVGVLREVFGVSDAMIAAEMRHHGRLAWEEPATHPGPLGDALVAIRPFVLRANDAGRALESYTRELAAVTQLAAKAWRIDPSGSVPGELDRLLAQAAERGLEGVSPRAWLEELLECLDDGRPAGKPSSTAINLLTSHSAKGLEWPVVIVLGLWRGIGQPPDRGLKMVRDSGGVRLYFDRSSLPEDTRDARERERRRELTRLLYVTLTRARQTLLVPWAGDGFGGRQRERPSLAELWGAPLDALAPCSPASSAGRGTQPSAAPIASPGPRRADDRSAGGRLPPLPARVLPHQLAHRPDLARIARHESSLDTPLPRAGADDAIDYGVWWHETMEFLPWSADDATITAYGWAALTNAAAQGLGARPEVEWQRFRASAAWRELNAARWVRCTELAVFGPLNERAWIDGVIDLVLHDPAANELWIVDWKTNHRRPHETDEQLLARLVFEYKPQLSAYAECAGGFFAGTRQKVVVFSTAAGLWQEVPRG
ncbi:MAG: UvrD-helicase domain-containing protein [Opitutaceae bacterium]|nr:UvrD-helicase domain-containing protein [Opitutaceae bacterium]